MTVIGEVQRVGDGPPLSWCRQLVVTRPGDIARPRLSYTVISHLTTHHRDDSSRLHNCVVKLALNRRQEMDWCKRIYLCVCC